MPTQLTSMITELVLLARQGHIATLSAQIGEFLTHLEVSLPKMPEQRQTAIIGSIPKLLRLQESEDWIGFADVLEYDLLPRI